MKPTALLIGLLICSPVIAGSSLNAMTGAPFKPDPTKPPDAIQMMQILLEHLDAPLKGTSCQGTDDDPTTLLDHVALMFGEIMNTRPHVADMVASCEPDKLEEAGALTDTWACTINITEQSKRGAHVANSSLRFSIERKSWRFFPNKLICN